MRILLSNDDGYFAPGLAALAAALAPLGTVTVVAPERNRSGASNSLTLDRPLMVRHAANGFLFVNGTPTDCVHLAVTGLLDHLPDIVVSGINDGANMGDDTIYSGTVAAATEGFLLGIPSIAISLADRDQCHYGTAAAVARRLVERFRDSPIAEPVLLNVNVPDVPEQALRGHAVTRLGKRHKAEPVVKDTNPRGETVYWVGAAGGAADAGEGTDFHAVAHGIVSITPLQIDLTQYGRLPAIRTGSAERRPAPTGIVTERGRATEAPRAAGPSSRHSGIGMTSQRTRGRMVERLRAAGIGDEVVLAAMQEVPRHIFVDEALASRAYDDVALPLGYSQTISNPHTVARMCEVMRNGRTLDKVLEIGTGCGYQAAVLSRIAREVWTIERIAPLLERARVNLIRELRIRNVRTRHGDGSAGIAEAGPFDGIVMAAAAAALPAGLKAQLNVGGRLVLPVGSRTQRLVVIERTRYGYTETELEEVRFVPLRPGKA